MTAPDAADWAEAEAIAGAHEWHEAAGLASTSFTAGHWSGGDWHSTLLVGPGVVGITGDVGMMTLAEARILACLLRVGCERGNASPEAAARELEAVTTAPDPVACAACGRTPAAGYAHGLDGKRLCHPDPILRPDETGPDCYHVTQGRPGHGYGANGPVPPAEPVAAPAGGDDAPA